MLNNNSYAVLILITSQLFASKFCLVSDLPTGEMSKATHCGKYKYRLWRNWNLGSNPDSSTYLLWNIEQITDPLWSRLEQKYEVYLLSYDQVQLLFLLQPWSHIQLVIQQAFIEHQLCASPGDTDIKNTDQELTVLSYPLPHHCPWCRHLCSALSWMLRTCKGRGQWKGEEALERLPGKAQDQLPEERPWELGKGHLGLLSGPRMPVL